MNLRAEEEAQEYAGRLEISAHRARRPVGRGDQAAGRHRRAERRGASACWPRST
ncbi:hypothetical protein ACRAWD_13055 [Caulobacter segnis]